VVILLGFVLCTRAIAADGAQHPNVVFILADDWGWGDLGCHGNKLVDTPNLDRLAREGTEFYQFNVGSPVCSPSRTAFMTGNFPARFSIHEAIGALAKNREVQQVDWLDPRAVTLPRLLQQAGYVTGHFGKWHLCSGQAGEAPMPAAYGVGEHGLFAGTAPPAAKTIESHHHVFDAATAFIRAHKDGPFYLNLWIHETHLAHMPTEESFKRYAKLGEQQRVYSAVVADGDNGIGKVLGALKELGLEQNTLVIFSSDNGPENTGRDKESRGELRGGYGGYYSVGSTGGSRGRKRSLYEGGVRLPFIVRWPGHVPAGNVNKTTSVASVDLLPTMCAAVGVRLPDGYKPDGENMLPALLGGENQRTKPIFWDWRGKDTPADCWPRWAVRDGDWKLVTDNGRRAELYHSPDDWAEARNVAKENPEIVTKLSAELAAWKASLPKEPAKEFISKGGRGKGRNKAAAQKKADE
jgi:N-acetylgalactosamine-6-sulfatase